MSDILLKFKDETGKFRTIAGIRLDDLDCRYSVKYGPGPSGDFIAVSHPLCQLTGKGVFIDSEADEVTRDLFCRRMSQTWSIEIPESGETITGPFMVTLLEYSGREDGEAVYFIGLTSAGAVEVTAGDQS